MARSRTSGVCSRAILASARPSIAAASQVMQLLQDVSPHPPHPSARRAECPPFQDLAPKRTGSFPPDLPVREPWAIVAGRDARAKIWRKAVVEAVASRRSGCSSGKAIRLHSSTIGRVCVQKTKLPDFLMRNLLPDKAMPFLLPASLQGFTNTTCRETRLFVSMGGQVQTGP